jgi:hypothetical protein
VSKVRSFNALATGNKCVGALGKEDVPTMELISRWPHYKLDPPAPLETT